MSSAVWLSRWRCEVSEYSWAHRMNNKSMALYSFHTQVLWFCNHCTCSVCQWPFALENQYVRAYCSTVAMETTQVAAVVSILKNVKSYFGHDILRCLTYSYNVAVVLSTGEIQRLAINQVVHWTDRTSLLYTVTHKSNSTLCLIAALVFSQQLVACIVYFVKHWVQRYVAWLTADYIAVSRR